MLRPAIALGCICIAILILIFAEPPSQVFAVLPTAILGFTLIVFCREVSALHEALSRAAPWLNSSGPRIRPIFFAMFGVAFLAFSAAAWFA